MLWLGKLLNSRVTWIVVIAIGSVSLLYRFYTDGYDRGVADERTRQLTAMTKAMGDMRKRHEQELKERGWQDKAEADQARVITSDLQNRLAELAVKPPKILIKTVVQHDENGCSCPTVSLGPEFWMSYRSAGGGGEADHAPAGPVPNQM